MMPFAASLLQTPAQIIFVTVLCGAAVVTVGMMKDTIKAYFRHGPFAAIMALAVGALVLLGVINILKLMDVGQQAVKDVQGINAGQINTRIKPGG